MTESIEDQDIQFFQLIISLHAGTMQQMGKVANPVSGEIERNLLAAKNSIDLLEMLQRKMKGNLSDGESKMLESALFELRMNYVDEVKKDAGKSDGSNKSDVSNASDETTDTTTSDNSESSVSGESDAPDDKAN